MLVTLILAFNAAAYAEEAKEDDKVLSFSGDARYRNEWSLELPNPDDPMRWRQRVRARLAVDAQLCQQLSAGMRMRTGNPEDPASPHHTLGTGFDSMELNLDRAFIRWQPQADASHIIVGKFDRGYAESPVYPALIWDEDIQAEGSQFNARLLKPKSGLTWDLRGSAYTTVETSKDLQEGWIFAGQSELGFKLADGRLTVANAFYYIPETLPGGSTLLLERNRGNAVETDADGNPTAYVSDFAILDNVVAGKLEFGGFKMDVGGRFLINLGAESDNIGWQVGAAVPLKIKGVKVKPYADVHALQSESFFSPVIGDEHQGGIGYTGVIGGATVGVTKAVDVKAYGIFETMDAYTDGRWHQRARLEVNAKF